MVYPVKVGEGGGGSESSQPANPFLNLTVRGWNPIFATRREFDYVSANTPFVRLEDLNFGDCLVDHFMTASDQSGAFVPEEKIQEYCFGTSLKALIAGKGDVIGPIAWLDERSSAGENERARVYRGPLTARHLYQELKRPRYFIGGATSTSNENRSAETTSDNNFSAWNSESESKTNSDQPPPCDPEPDAERRKIFITDLDCWSICALMGTASHLEASGLCDAFYKYLTFQNFIGVRLSHRGFDMFQLVFHIPFYVWRASDKAREDHRLNQNAERLRQSQDVSFLNWKSAVSDFLYEAQISCLIAGQDDWRWVAYCFVDTYFDAADEGKETVENYHEDSVADGGMIVDPLTFGTSLADESVQTPREYFLLVFQSRMSQVKCEWEQVVVKIQQSIREYVLSYSHSLYISRERSTAAKEENEKVHLTRDWIVLVKRLTAQLLEYLSKTVDACKKFCLDDAIYFRNLSEGLGARSLHAIQITFEELETLKKTLESLAARCEGYFLELELVRKLEMNLKSSWLDHLPFLNGMMAKLPRNPNISAMYSQLSFRNSEIRLLKFVAPWTGMTLACSLVTVPLPKAPKYAALSYHWGTQNKKVLIRLNSLEFPVTANLYGALLRLRAEGVQHVWADALCINQEDFDERSFQVARMGTIFQRACQVAVWLGAEPRTGEEMRLLQHGTSYLTLDHYPNITTPALFDELLSRPYWGRVWIIQEVTVAAEVVVYFGRCRMSWDEFVCRCGLPLDGTIPSSGLSGYNTRGITTLLQFRHDKIGDRPINFLEALYRSRSSLSTNPRDKLFAILGLSYNGKNFIPEPNYMYSPEVIFTEFMSALIKSPAPLDYIYLKSARRKNNDKLPSWVPDWTDLDDIVTRRQFDYIIQGPSRHSEYNGFEWKNAITISETELTVSGMIVDIVGGLGNIFAGGEGDIEAPIFPKSPNKVRLDFGPEMASLVYETITGVGLLPERGYDNKDRHYADLDGPWSDDQMVEHESSPLPSHDTTLELLAAIDTWLAANSSFNIAGQDLKYWWKMLHRRSSQIGDAPRITHHFYNSIRCDMRILATEKGYLGWIHPQAQTGDKIVRIFGCSQHVVLRVAQKRYRVVGDAILSGAEIGDQKYRGCKEDLRII